MRYTSILSIIGCFVMITSTFVICALTASAQDWVHLDGVVRFADRSLCSYTNPFFEKQVYALVQLVDPGGNIVDPDYPDAASHLGVYEIYATQPITGSMLRVTCESLVVEHPLSAADIRNGHVDIALPNHKPVATAFTATLNGKVVERAPGGSTLAVSVAVTDPDGDPLHFSWGASAGTTTNTDTPLAIWTLPNSRGLHFLYVLVADGKGGYEEKQLAISTDGDNSGISTGMITHDNDLVRPGQNDRAVFLSYLPIILRGSDQTTPDLNTPTTTPTPTPTSTPTLSSTPPSSTPTAVDPSTSTPTAIPTSTMTPTGTATGTSTATSTPSFTPTATATATPTSSPTPTATPLKPSDHVPAGNHFLTYAALSQYNLSPASGIGGPLDNRISACRYYRDIGVVADCTATGQPTGAQLTFAAWKQAWGFGASPNEATAIYANLADLNLQRDMHTLRKAGSTDVASYVCNSPNPPDDVTLSNARLGNNVVACVAFEFSRGTNPQTGQPYNNGQPFTKFITFGPTGELLLSVNLDGRGEKFIPGACVACHGGSYYEGQYGVGETIPTTPNLYAQFIPYDLDNYQFSTLPGYQRTDQEASLRALNAFVLDTNPYSPTIELINGWYPTSTSTHNGSYVPPGWVGHEDLYNVVVKPSCRMCHVALDPTYIPFNTYTNFAGETYFIGGRVCGSESIRRYWYGMPNAKETFDRFWKSSGSGLDKDQPAKLIEFLIAEKAEDANGDLITKCELPSWLP